MKQQTDMRFQRLNSKDDLKEYQKRTHKQLGIKFPMAYISRSQVMALFDSNDNMLGAFMVVPKPPFRVIESLPPEIKREIGFIQDKSVELTGLWISKDVRCRNTRLKFWLIIYRDLIFRWRKGVVFAFSAKHSHLEKIYSVINPSTIFRGETALLPGMEKPEVEAIQWSSRLDLLAAPLKRPDFVINRLFRKPNLRQREAQV